MRDDVPPSRRDGTIRLGLDTGGTYTDAVILAAGKRVVASAKALTTKHDLAIGLAGAIREVVAALPPDLSAADISLVSVSTTLATNAVVEQQRSPIWPFSSVTTRRCCRARGFARSWRATRSR